MHKVAVLNDYQNAALQMADWSEVQARTELHVFNRPFESIDAAAAALGDFTILCLMRERLRFPAEMFARLPNLKCVVTTGSYNLEIDLDAARKQGVVVCGTTNGLGRRATAELTWGLILALAKHIVREDREIRRGSWQTTVGTMLYGKTLGIVGLGGVGGTVAGYAKAFGMRVLAWSENLTSEKAREFDAQLVDKETLLRESDIVTLHTILSDRTRGLIGESELAQMKKTALLVNTSRGPVVDERALMSALENGGISGAAIDVFENEPLPLDHPFRTLPDRILVSPHIGYVADEVYEVFYTDTVQAVLAYLDGAPIRVLA